MKYREHYFKRESTINNTDIVIIDLNVKEPIQSISIEYEATNGATSCVDHELHDDIESIEVTEQLLQEFTGGFLLISHDRAFVRRMEQARALNFFETGILPYEDNDEGAGAVQAEKCYINFGRGPDDGEMFLRPSDYKNLQLRLTHSLTVSATAGFATGTGKGTVIAKLIEEGVTTYRGCLAAKEVVSYTSVTSGDKEVNLPTNKPYRLMMFQALATTYRHDECLTRHKLSIDGDSYVPFDMYAEDLDDINRSRFGLSRQLIKCFSKDTSTTLTDIYNIRDARVRISSTADCAFVAALDAEVVTVAVVDFSTVGTPALQTTEDEVIAVVEGTQPYACLAYAFGSLWNPVDWLDAAQYDDIRLYSTQAVAAACTVVLQQLMT